MDSILLRQLQEVAQGASPAQAAAARELLACPDQLDEESARNLVDAYLNDPYLTK